MQTRIRWQTVLSIGMLLAVLASAAGYFYWANRPFTLEQLAPVDTPTLVHRIKADPRKPFDRIVQWNSRGDRLAVSSDKNNILIYSSAGELVADFRSHLFMGLGINALEWHPTKDILAVAYDERLVLWSADGTIIKQINSDITFAFWDIDWNQQTEQLAVNQYYAFDRKYYHQIALFDDTGALIKQISPSINFTRDIKWLDENQIVINTANDEILVLDTEKEILGSLIAGKYTEMDVDQQHHIIAAVSTSLKAITLWNNNQLTELPVDRIAGDVLAINPASNHTIIYQPTSELRMLNHQSHNFELYPTIKFDETIYYVAWHPSKPILAILLTDEIQLWQFPE